MRQVHRRLLVAVVTTMLGTAPVVFQATPAAALPAGGGTSEARGFDTCAAPSTSAMNAWWPNTPWWWVGIYIGGNTRGCSQPNLTSSWLNTNYNTGWRYEPLWVGPQAPCTGFINRFSYNTTTAYQQGQNEAISAFQTLLNLGFGSNALGTPVVYDMENFDTSNGSCVAAVKSFVAGWDYDLHISPAQRAGYYGSACASDVNAMASANPPPDFINGADWSGNPSTSSIACVSSGNWTNHQRLKQFVGGHNETWNGVTINIDTDCANGPVAPSASPGVDSSCL